MSGMVHSVTATVANVHDISEVHKLIREDDKVVYGDAGYLGIEKREEIKDDECLNKKEYKICNRPGKVRRMNDDPTMRAKKEKKNIKSQEKGVV